MTPWRGRCCALAVVLAGAVTAFSGSPLLADEPAVYSMAGIAISGYDPVAYFTEGRPVRGNARHALMWRGTTWYFASEENLLAFEMNPEAFAPQYGGYCAMAVSRGTIAATMPEAFRIVDGKLYLNNSMQVLNIWAKDAGGNITKANEQWPAVLGKN